MKHDATFTNSIGMDFVLIPAGTFWMGSADDDKAGDDIENDFFFDREVPRHEVTISRPFYLGKYPVTQAQWQAVMGNNPSWFKGADRPVEWVSWEEAQAFIAKLNALEGHNRYRLPTEAEWEYACRAGSETALSFGDDADVFEDYYWYNEELDNYAWYSYNSGGETHPVGQKRPNTWGLYDMHGNVWEWVQDWYDDYSAEAAVDPKGPGVDVARALRGGGCGSAWDCRSTCREWADPGHRSKFLGCRLALSLED